MLAIIAGKKIGKARQIGTFPADSGAILRFPPETKEETQIQRGLDQSARRMRGLRERKNGLYHEISQEMKFQVESVEARGSRWGKETHPGECRL